MCCHPGKKSDKSIFCCSFNTSDIKLKISREWLECKQTHEACNLLAKNNPVTLLGQFFIPRTIHVIVLRELRRKVNWAILFSLFSRIFIPTFAGQCQDVATKQRLSPQIVRGVTQCLEELRWVRPLIGQKCEMSSDWSQGHRVGQLPGELWQRPGRLCQPVPGGDLQRMDWRDGWCCGLWSSNECSSV